MFNHGTSYQIIVIVNDLINWLDLKNPAKHISSRQINEMYSEDQFEFLLKESELVSKRRERASRMLLALNEAHKVLSSLRDMPGN